MSNKIRKIEKSLKNQTRFPTEMYNHTLGSVVISAIILNPKEEYDLNAIGKKWKKISKKPEDYIDFWLDDEKFIDKSLELFNVKRPEYFPIAFVQGKINSLFLPYDEEEEKVYPIREDGTLPNTAYSGKIYPIDFEGENEDKD